MDKKMKKYLNVTVIALLLGFFSACKQSNLVAVTELDLGFREITLTMTDELNSQANLLSEDVSVSLIDKSMFDIDTKGDGEKDTRYLSFKVNVRNNSKQSLTNLALLAVNDTTTNQSGTAFKDVLLSNGKTASTELIRSIKPTHGLSFVAGRASFKKEDADFMAIQEKNLTNLKSTKNITALPYAYSVSSQLASGETAEVTLGFRLALAKDGLEAIEAFAFQFSVVELPELNVTQAPDKIKEAFIENSLTTVERAVKDSVTSIVFIGEGQRYLPKAYDLDSILLENLRIALIEDNLTPQSGYLLERAVKPEVLTLHSGAPDLSFGHFGQVSTQLNGRLKDSLIDPSGRIAVTGYTLASNNSSIFLLRFLTDGSLDSDFHTDGRVFKRLASDSSDRAYSVASNSEGKLMIAARTIRQGNANAALLLYNNDGSLNTSFANDGSLIFHEQGSSSATKVLSDSEGRWLVALERTLSGLQTSRICRYLASGQADLSFGDANSHCLALPMNETLNDGTFFSNQPVQQMILDSSGQIYIKREYSLIRLTQEGHLDDFDIPLGYGDTFHLDEMGRILVTKANHNQRLAFLYRFKQDGSRDTSFGSQGRLSLNPFPWYGSSISVQNEYIYVLSHFFGAYYTIRRYQSTGTLDSSFANNGSLTLNRNNIRALHIDDIGRLVLVEQEYNAGDYSIKLERFWP